MFLSPSRVAWRKTFSLNEHSLPSVNFRVGKAPSDVALERCRARERERKLHV